MKKILIGGGTIVSLIIAVLLIYFGYIKPSERSGPITEPPADSIRIITADELAEYPEKFKGYIGITGKITKVDITNRIFTLGCEDACLQIPVRYQGQVPESGAEIIAYGQVKKEGNKYLFEATEVKTK